MANKGEDITGHNYVADQLNWEQRVKTEVEAPRQWSEQWGPIFQEEKEGVDPLEEGVRLREQFYESRIERLKAELAEMDAKGAPTLQTQNAQYGIAPAFKKVGVKNFGIKRDAKLGGPTSNLT